MKFFGFVHLVPNSILSEKVPGTGFLSLLQIKHSTRSVSDANSLLCYISSYAILNTGMSETWVLFQIFFVNGF